MVSGVSELRYVSRGLTTLGHTPSAGHGENRVRRWRRCGQGKGGAGRRRAPLLTVPQLVLLLGVARRRLGGSRLGAAPLPPYGVLAAILVLSHWLIPAEGDGVGGVKRGDRDTEGVGKKMDPVVNIDKDIAN